MRAVDPNLQAKLDSGATTLCRCWLLTRKDGQTFAFTDHDRDLDFAGNLYQAGSGMDTSALESSTGLSVDNAQAVGALSATGLQESDIRAGLFDAAKVAHWIVDWTDPSLSVLLFVGSLGEIKRGDNAFEAELRGLSEGLNQPVGRSFTRACDRVLGDAKCGFDLNTPGYTVLATVSAVTDRRRFQVGALGGVAAEWFAHGTVEWLTGANAGARHEIKFDVTETGGRRIELWQETPFPMQANDTCNLIAGCDKTAAMCKGKFLNFNNFRGFPHIPGEDWAHAYPNSGGRHDGTSRYK